MPKSTYSANQPSWLSLALLCVAFRLALLTAWGPTFEHLQDPGWTEHQKLHVFREIFLATVFSIVGIGLCLGPLRRGRAFSLQAVGLVGFGVVAGFWFGVPIIGIGKNDIAPYVNHGIQLVCLAVGYGLAYYSQGRKDALKLEEI